MVQIVAAIRRRYCIEDAVINYTTVDLLAIDLIRNKVNDIVFDKINLNEILTRLLNLKKVGKEDDCEIDRLFYLQMLEEYFIIIKQEVNCTSETDFKELSEEYKLDCIRNILTCNYGLGNLVNELVDGLGLLSPYNGVGYMTISLQSCAPFIVYGRNS